MRERICVRGSIPRGSTKKTNNIKTNMKPETKQNKTQMTVAQYNSQVTLACDVLTGKQLRRAKRAAMRKNKFGSC